MTLSLAGERTTWGSPTPPPAASGPSSQAWTTLARIATDDSIACWGAIDFGQSDAPAGAYKAVAAGAGHSCAIAADGTIACWGANDFGKSDAPAGIYKAVSAGDRHNCAIAADDTVTCWGENTWLPADPPEGIFKAITAGTRHNCATAPDDTTACWGYNPFGQPWPRRASTGRSPPGQGTVA